MKRIQRKWLVIPLFAALIACFIFLKPSPVWEVRATILVRGEAARTVPALLESAFFSRHLREISDFDGPISASAIPGTRLVQLTLREDTKSHALAGMEAALNRISPVMGYFTEDFSMEILLEPRIFEHSTQPDPAPCLLAGAAILLLFLPAPKFREELDLLDLLRRFGRLTKRLWIPALVVCLLVSCGYYVYRKVTYIPVFQANAVVSVGDYDAQTVSQLPATVRGLLNCDLLARELPVNCRISAEAAADSNLFTLTAAASAPDAAQTALNTAITRWPALTGYAEQDLSIHIHETEAPGLVNPFPGRSVGTTGFLLGLLCWSVCAFALLLFRQNVDTAACKAYNESQS